MLFGRRVTFAILILAALLLLMAMSIAWCVHMVLIAKYGEVYFVESNPMVLYGEIVATALITLFGGTIFVLQVKRLAEKRRGDDERRSSRG